MAEMSAWRTNDVVAFDVMREAATTLTALLVNAARSALDPQTARGELAQLRRDVLAVDAYDRAAVAALASRVNVRIRQLSGEF